jgi:hypothetical protein
MYDTVLPAGSVSEIALRTNIAKVLGIAAITSSELKSLMVDGKSQIGGREVKMTDTKYMLCAYGDCTNPGIAIEPGKINIPGSGSVPISAESVTGPMEQDRYNLTTSSEAKTVGLTGAIGWVGTTPPVKEKPTATKAPVEPIPAPVVDVPSPVVVNPPAITNP